MKLIPVAVAVTLLTGCAGVNKEGIGTIAGGLAGAVIGNKVGGKEGAVIGAVIGAAIGNRIGAHLDEEDRKRLAELERKALTTGAGGSFVTNKTKATVTVGVAQPTLEKPRDYGLANSVTPQPLVLTDPITIRTYVDTPVFNTTSESGSPKLMIAAGVPIKISARVANADWMMVGNETVGLGYVPRRYLESNIVAEAKSSLPAAGSAPAPGAKKPTPTVTVARNTPPAKPLSKLSKEAYEKEMDRLHAAYKPRSSQGAGSPQGGGSSPSGLVVTQASSECKVVTRSVAPPQGGGDPFTESVKYCNEPPRGWQTQTA